MGSDYRYNPRQFAFNVTFIGIFCAGIALVGLWSLAFGAPLPSGIAWVALTVAGYQVWNTFIAIANPAHVYLDDDTLAFGAYGRTDSFSLADPPQIRIREFPDKERLYLRIGDGGLLHGRYWIRTGCFERGDELFDHLVALELLLDPQSLKAKSRGL